MNTVEKKGPNKPFSLFTIIFYNIANLIFLMTILFHLPFLNDTINFNQSYHILNLFDEVYFSLDIGAALLQLVCVIIILSVFGSKGFPTFLSVISAGVNFVVSTLFSIIIYIVDLRDIYFSLQVLYLIPVITIFLSSIFLYDDLFDLLRNRYRPAEATSVEEKKHNKEEYIVIKSTDDDAEVRDTESEDRKKLKAKKIRKKKGELKTAERPDDENLIIPEDSFFNQQKIISSAAEKAVPDLNSKSKDKKEK